MRKILSVLLCVILLCPITGTYVFAADKTSYELEGELLGWFGIDAKSEDKLTRGEYAMWIAKLAALNTDESDTSFSDVSKTYKYSGAVASTTAAGYFSGKNKNIFGKDDEITYIQAIIPMVKLTGYNVYAEENGKYPDGYLQAAAKAGFAISTDVNNALTRQQAVRICAMALRTKIMLTDYSGTSTSRSDQTILSHYNDIYKSRGIVTANEYTDMYSERGCIRNKISIDKTEYAVSDGSYNNYISRNIDFYYKDRENDDPIVVAAALNKNSKSLTVKASSDNKIENGRFCYKNENGSVKSIEIARGFDLIINNGTVFNPTDEDLLFRFGALTFVDNNADGKYESVVAERAESMIIDGVDLFSEIIYYDGGCIQTDSLDDTKYNCFYDVDSDGNEKRIGIDYLKKGMVLTVFRSENENYVRAYQTDNVVSGKFLGKDEDELKIGEETYRYKPSVSDNIGMGCDVDAYFDYLGYVVKMEEISTDYLYGYLYRILYNEDNLSARFKIFTTRARLEEFESEEEIYVDNRRVDAEELRDNAGLYNDDKLIRQVVRYKLRKGKIYAVDTEAVNDSNKERDSLKCFIRKKSLKYYPTISMVGGNVKITDKTLFLTIPSIEAEIDDEDCYSYSYDFGDYPSPYTFSVYDIDENNSAGAVIMHSSGSMRDDDKTTVKSSIGIISKVSNAVNEDGELVKKISMYTENDKIETYYTKQDRCKNFSADFGTVVEYVLQNGEITGISAELVPGDSPETANEPAAPSSGDYNFCFGKVKKVLNDYITVISISGNKDFDDSLDYIWVAPSSSEKVFVVDIAERRINTGTGINLHEGAYVMIRSFRGYRNLHMIVFEY